jgi:cysteine desulfurase
MKMQPEANMAYLDYNATAPVRAEVVDAMVEAMAKAGNPSSVHGPGRRARVRMDRARALVADAVCALPDEIIFTSGGTESNDLALSGLGAEQVIISAIEHDAIAKRAHQLGIPCTTIPVDGHGVIDLEALAHALHGAPKNTLVSIMLANNETGVVQPVAQAARLAHDHGCLIHTDAVQAFGKIPVDLDQLGVDLMSISAHKFGGPQGIGALVARDVALSPRLLGGAQERQRRAGTENLAAIAGFGVAVQLMGATHGTAALRDHLESEIRAHAPEAVIFGQAAPRLPNTSLIALPDAPSETQVIAMDLAGIALSSGAACSSGKVHNSHVLAAMGAGLMSNCAIRISLGWQSTPQDIDHFLTAWFSMRARMRARVSRPASASAN